MQLKLQFVILAICITGLAQGAPALNKRLPDDCEGVTGPQSLLCGKGEYIPPPHDTRFDDNSCECNSKYCPVFNYKTRTMCQ